MLSGLATVSENGKLVGPVKGSRGVYVFTVTDKTVSEQPFDAQTETQKIQQNYGYLINSRLMEVFRDIAEVKNTMGRFFKLTYFLIITECVFRGCRLDTRTLHLCCRISR